MLNTPENVENNAYNLIRGYKEEEGFLMITRKNNLKSMYDDPRNSLCRVTFLVCDLIDSEIFLVSLPFILDQIPSTLLYFRSRSNDLQNLTR